jgi:hypothetical protein
MAVCPRPGTHDGFIADLPIEIVDVVFEFGAQSVRTPQEARGPNVEWRASGCGSVEWPLRESLLPGGRSVNPEDSAP